MARDWNNTPAVREDILNRMAKFGENIAEFPLTQTLERRDGKLVWVVDIHIKVARLVEFDLTGEGDTLAEALRKVYLGLNSQANLYRNVIHGNTYTAVPA